jgi:signal recognition particle subunit SRP54
MRGMMQQMGQGRMPNLPGMPSFPGMPSPGMPAPNSTPGVNYGKKKKKKKGFGEL